MGIKDDMKVLNRDIDIEYENYQNELKIANDQKLDIVQQCNAEIGIIDSERHLMREEIRKTYNFLKKFGSLKNQITLFDFIAEGRVKQVTEFPQSKIDKIIIDEKSWLDGGINKFIAYKKNKKRYAEKVNEFSFEKVAHKQHIDKIKDDIKMGNLILSIVKLYRVSITMVKDTVQKISSEFDLVEAFIIADKLKDNVINGDAPYAVSFENYDIEVYEGSAYDKHYIFVRNVFDYYQFITKVYTECILGKIIEDSIVTNEEREVFETKLKEIEMRSQNLICSIE